MPCAALFRICVLLAVFLLLPGCRTAAPSASASAIGPATAPEPTPKTSSDVIGFVEIQKMQGARVPSAYEVVIRLRPEFLRRYFYRSNGDPQGPPTIYLDGVRQGGPDMLHSIPIAAIHEIRYLSPTAAAARFAPFHGGGVILVRSRSSMGLGTRD